MDSKPNQTPNNSYKHAMSNGASKHPQTVDNAKEEIWKFVADNMKTATSTNGKFTDAQLDALGDAIHTLQDYTSPMHTDRSGNPIAWLGMPPDGPVGPAYNHRVGEMSPANDWSRFGDAIRISLAAFVQGNPKRAQEYGLTDQNYEQEANRRISDYVRQYFYFNNIRNPGAEDAARQCALGNPAAC